MSSPSPTVACVGAAPAFPALPALQGWGWQAVWCERPGDIAQMHPAPAAIVAGFGPSRALNERLAQGVLEVAAASAPQAVLLGLVPGEAQGGLAALARAGWSHFLHGPVDAYSLVSRLEVLVAEEAAGSAGEERPALERVDARSLLQAVPAPALLLDAGGVVQALNEAAGDLFGAEAEAFCGRAATSLIAGLAEEPEGSWWQDGVEWTYRRRKLATAGAEYAGSLLVLERAGRANGPRPLETFLPGETHIAFRLDADLRLIDLSPAWENLCESAREEALGEPLTAFILEEDHARLDPFAEEAGRARAGEHAGVPLDLEADVRLLCGGRARWFRLAAKALFDEKGRFSGVGGLLRDVHREKQATEELVSTHAMLKGIFENAHEGIAIFDDDGRLLDCNQRYLDLFGLPHKEREAERRWELMCDSVEDETAFLEQNRGILERPGEAVVDHVKLADGVVVERSFTPFLLGEKRFGRVCTFRDVTSLHHRMESLQEDVEKAGAAVKAKSAFLATMSHELRTPLNSIIGFSDLLTESYQGKEEQDYAEIIRANAETLLDLINQILDLSKLEAQRLELDPAPFEIDALIESVADLFAPRLFDKRVELACGIDPEVEDILVGDSLRLRQILINLVNNAFKFTHEGSVEVLVHREHGEDGAPGLLHFCVRDTGPGIPEDKREAIFKPFAQESSSVARQHGGSGLGLAISRELVELMGGEIWVEGSEGEGAAFHFTVQAPADENSLLLRESEKSAPFEPSIAGHSLLAVSALEANRLALRRTSERHGLGLQLCATMEEAREALGETVGLDAVLLEAGADAKSGEELAGSIRAVEGAEKIPLLLSLAVPGGTSRQSAPAGLSLLRRPYRQGEVVAALRAAFDGGEVGGEEEPPPAFLLALGESVEAGETSQLLRRRGYAIKAARTADEAREALSEGRFEAVLVDDLLQDDHSLDLLRDLREADAGAVLLLLAEKPSKKLKARAEKAGADSVLDRPLDFKDLRTALRKASAARSSGE